MIYEFTCPQCHTQSERSILLAEFDQQVTAQRCELCDAILRKIFSIPTLRTDTAFMAGADVSDDGFGTDDNGRRLARAKAAAAGVNISGKRFHPGLCRRGVPFDPQAWYGDKADVRRKAQALGRNVRGCVDVESPIPDAVYKKAETPYRVAPSMVAKEVKQEIKEKHGGKATPAQRQTITEKYIEQHSGTPEVSGKVRLAP